MRQAEILLQNLRSIQVKVSVENGKLIIDSPEKKLSPAIKELLRTNKAEIVGLVTSEQIVAHISNLDSATIELINQRCKKWDMEARATASKFIWSEASLF